MSNLSFEAGRFYLTRDGQRVLIVLVRQGYLVGEIDGDDKPTVWTRAGTWSIGGFDHILDLVSEWVPPKKWVVRVYQHLDGRVIPTIGESNDPSTVGRVCKLAGSATVTEGEFAKDTQ